MAPLAAAVHLGYLPPYVNTQAELKLVLNTKICIPWRQGCTKRELGTLLYIGLHPHAEVYIMPVGKKPELVLKTFSEMVSLLGDDLAAYHLVNCEAELKKRAKKRAWLSSRLNSTTYNLIGSMVTVVQKGLTE